MCPFWLRASKSLRKLGILARNLLFLVLKYDLYNSSMAVLTMSRACWRGRVLVLARSAAIAGSSAGVAAISFLAWVMILSETFGG